MRKDYQIKLLKAKMDIITEVLYSIELKLDRWTAKPSTLENEVGNCTKCAPNQSKPKQTRNRGKEAPLPCQIIHQKGQRQTGALRSISSAKVERQWNDHYGTNWRHPEHRKEVYSKKSPNMLEAWDEVVTSEADIIGWTSRGTPTTTITITLWDSLKAC